MLIGHSVSPATEGTYMNTMSAHDASAIVTDLRDSGIQSWVMGGWGIDALLARTTRPHHDLDLLVHVADLPALAGWMRANGFEWAYDWEEARTFHQGGQELSTAFVATHTDGRELDIHAVNIDHNGQCVLATDDPWQLPPDTLFGTGTISGVRVRCVSSAAQAAMHSGYELPAHHLQDLEALRHADGN